MKLHLYLAQVFVVCKYKSLIFFYLSAVSQIFAKSARRISAQFRTALSFKFDKMHYISVDVSISLG